MFVQLNPDVSSYSESLSTLKFAERVSGIELGAARSSKEGKDVRELIEQVLNYFVFSFFQTFGFHSKSWCFNFVPEFAGGFSQGHNFKEG